MIFYEVGFYSAHYQ